MERDEVIREMGNIIEAGILHGLPGIDIAGHALARAEELGFKLLPGEPSEKQCELWHKRDWGEAFSNDPLGALIELHHEMWDAAGEKP